MFTEQDYRNDVDMTWCKRCYFRGVYNALISMMAHKQIDPSELTIVSGIGCSSRLPFYTKTPAMHTLHGRAIPTAAGIRISSPERKVLVIGGDGDLFSIGIGHFVHAARRNIDMTVLCLDNRMYAMTKNQSSPTSPTGHLGSLTPFGESADVLNVIEFAIASNATFVARSFAGAPEHLESVLSSAVEHKGFSFVEVIAPCQKFEKDQLCINSIKDRLIEITTDQMTRIDALETASHAMDFDSDKNAPIAVGVFWKQVLPTYEEKISWLQNRSGKAQLGSMLDTLR